MTCNTRATMLTFVLAILATTQIQAETHIAPPTDLDLIGELQKTYSHSHETLVDVALRELVGQTEIVLANPEGDRWITAEDKSILLPTRYILPDTVRTGIVLNLPEFRLYHYQDSHRGVPPLVSTYAVSIGRHDWPTPLGITKVISKTKNPVWTPPESIRREAEANGRDLPQVVPAGPDNPLGDYALRLAIPGYLLHGTNRSLGIGMRVTHGCIRLYPQDIARLFYATSIDTPVRLINQPIKAGWYADKVYLEVHPPLDEFAQTDDELVSEAIRLINIKLKGTGHKVRSSLIRQIVRQKTGVPTLISSK